MDDKAETLPEGQIYYALTSNAADEPFLPIACFKDRFSARKVFRELNDWLGRRPIDADTREWLKQCPMEECFSAELLVKIAMVQRLCMSLGVVENGAIELKKVLEYG